MSGKHGWVWSSGEGCGLEKAVCESSSSGRQQVKHRSNRDCPGRPRGGGRRRLTGQDSVTGNQRCKRTIESKAESIPHLKRKDVLPSIILEDQNQNQRRRGKLMESRTYLGNCWGGGAKKQIGNWGEQKDQLLWAAFPLLVAERVSGELPASSHPAACLCVGRLRIRPWAVGASALPHPPELSSGAVAVEPGRE